MRYAPDTNLLFIHIPKTAGMSVKDAMRPWSRSLNEEMSQDTGTDTSQKGSEKYSQYLQHDALGPIHLAHIPLPLIRQHFPATYARVKAAEKFAILRNPHERFLSAVSQNLREYQEVGASHVSDDLIRETARKMVDELAEKPMFADRHYIHFAPQSWFLEDDEEPVEVKLFAMDRMGRLARWLTERTGHEVSFGARNTTVRPKSGYTALHAGLTAAGRIVPKSLRSKLRGAMLNTPMYSKSWRSAQFAFDPDVQAFIDRYYARDWELYRSTLAD